MIQRTMLLVVGYIRMSTAKQEDSPARQRKLIEEMAVREGWQIIAWYEDHGLTGTESLNRPEFQRLLIDAKAGEFQGIVMSEQSRFSREDLFDAIAHFRVLRDADIRLFTVQRGEIRLNELGGVITAIVDQHGAHEESLTIATRSTSGRRAKAKRGIRTSGQPLFGFDRVFFDARGQEVHRVAFNEKFAKPDQWTFRLEPAADVKAVKAVRWAFDAYLRGIVISAISDEFQRRGFLTTKGNPWTCKAIKRLLTNPAYAGTVVAGRFSRGKFARIDTEGVIVREGAQAGIIDRETFDDVQQALKVRQTSQAHDGYVYLLSGVVRCGECGAKCYGTGDDESRVYYCSDRESCSRSSITCDHLDNAVLEAIKTHVLARANIGFCRQQANSDGEERAETTLDKAIAALNAKIERATENLALAGSQAEFVAVSRKRCDWQEELRELLRESVTDAPTRQECVEALKWFDSCRDDLHHSDPLLLADAVRTVIKRIRIRKQTVSHSRGNVVLRRAVIEFHQEHYFGNSLVLEDEKFGPKPRWREVAEYVISRDEAVKVGDVAKQFDVSPSCASIHLIIGAAVGLVKRNGHKQGWSANA